MSSLLTYLTVMQNDDPISVLNRRQTMRDDSDQRSESSTNDARRRLTYGRASRVRSPPELTVPSRCRSSSSPRQESESPGRTPARAQTRSTVSAQPKAPRHAPALPLGSLLSTG